MYVVELPVQPNINDAYTPATSRSAPVAVKVDLADIQECRDYHEFGTVVMDLTNGVVVSGVHTNTICVDLANASAPATSHATATTDEFSISSNVVTRGGTSFVTDGFAVGQWVKMTGWTAGGNNGVPLRITAVDATTMTLTGATLTDQSAEADIVITQIGMTVHNA